MSSINILQISRSLLKDHLNLKEEEIDSLYPNINHNLAKPEGVFKKLYAVVGREKKFDNFDRYIQENILIKKRTQLGFNFKQSSHDTASLEVLIVLLLLAIGKHQNSGFYKLLAHRLAKKAQIKSFSKKISSLSGNVHKTSQNTSDTALISFITFQIDTYFHRSLLLLNHLFPEAKSIFLKRYSLDDFKSKNPLTQFFNFIRHEINIGNNKNAQLREILLIEYEKLKLFWTYEAQNENYLKKCYWDREHFFKLNDDDILNIILVVDPTLRKYQSNWNWSLKEIDAIRYKFVDNLNHDKEDYFFVFHQMHFIDSKIKTNVFEYPISDYEYILLELCETPKDVKIILHEFVQMLEISSESDFQSLKQNIIKLIQNAVYMKYLVSPKALALLP